MRLLWLAFVLLLILLLTPMPAKAGSTIQAGAGLTALR
jgi:hypothetical protein